MEVRAGAGAEARPERQAAQPVGQERERQAVQGPQPVEAPPAQTRPHHLRALREMLRYRPRA